MELVSVIVPAFNAQESLRRCLDSVLGQSYSRLEVIVVNDGSVDSTAAIAAEYANRIIYIEQSNEGETAARNRGFSAASGQYISFIDHDDFWEPRFIAECVEFLRTHSEAIGVSVGVEHRNALKSGSVIKPAFLTSLREQNKSGHMLSSFFDFWAVQDHICAGSAMMRAEVIRATGGQRTDLVLSGDMEFWAYLATFGPWGFIPQVLLHVDGTQVSGGNLYKKFYSRFQRVSSIAAWSERVSPRVTKADRRGFERILARVASGYIFAHVFVKRDKAALETAKQFGPRLEGRFGTLWRLASSGGWVVWKVTCAAIRFRTAVQYWRAGLRIQQTQREKLASDLG